MREVTVRLRFTSHCLGNVKRKRRSQGGKICTCFLLPRTPEGRISFLPGWWRANMAFAAEVLGRLQAEAKQVHFETVISGEAPRDKLFRRYYEPNRFALHEAFWPGQVIEVRCASPHTINDADLQALFGLAGRFRGISPAKPREFGFFTVESVRPANEDQRKDDGVIKKEA